MKTALLSILFLLGSCVLYAQDPNNLAVDGTLKDENGGRMTGASVVLIQDGNQIKEVKTGKNGRFDLYLDFGHEFIIEVRKSGYVTKKLYFNTNNVPEDEQMWGYEFGGFVVDMVKRMDGVDYSILDQPIGKVYYEANVENFVNDRVYTRQIKEELNRMEEAQKEKIRQEEERAKQLEEDFNVAMQDAERAMRDGDYLLAKDNLLAAKNMKPQSQVPDKMLAEVEAKISAQGAKEERYQSLLSTADDALLNEKFADAIGLYKKALEIKPGEKYPTDQIAKAEEGKAAAQLAAAEATKAEQEERQYNETVAKGDEAFNNAEYSNAKTYYQNALNFKDDPYPKAQLQKIEAELLKIAAAKQANEAAQKKEAEYQVLIEKGDVALNAGNFDEAKTHYEGALQVKSGEAYPQDQLKAIAVKLEARDAEAAALAAQNKVNAEYRELISQADALFQQKELESAKAKYEAALALKGEESYPKSQIGIIAAELERIDLLAKDKAEKDRIQKEFDAAVANADKLFDANKLSEAKAEYERSLEIKGDERYPMDQIARIAATMETQAKEQAVQKQYDELVSKADASFASGAWQESIGTYEAALRLKQTETYPKERIELARAKLDEEKQLAQQEARNAQLKAQYDALISKADQALDLEDYTLAKANYESALKLIQEEYPRNQIAKITQIQNELAEQAKKEQAEKELESNYQQTVQRADVQFNNENYAQAKETYNLALGFKADETYPKERIKEIDDILARLADAKEKRSRYEALLKQGNEAVSQRDYPTARKNYLDALELYPDEQIPKTKLDMIKKLEEKAEQDRIDAEYKSVILEADKAFMSEDYEEATKQYKQALEVKPNESYPRDRIKKIEEILAEIARQAQIEDEQSQKRVIEETFDQGRTKVTVRRVIVDGKENVYKRVVHDWGGKYYFLDEQPITELVWNRETSK